VPISNYTSLSFKNTATNKCFHINIKHTCTFDVDVFLNTKPFHILQCATTRVIHGDFHGKINTVVSGGSFYCSRSANRVNISTCVVWRLH